MDKNLDLGVTRSHKSGDLLARQLSCRNDAAKAALLQRFYTCRAVRRALCAGVQGEIGECLAQEIRRAKVGDDQRVHTALIGDARRREKVG